MIKTEHEKYIGTNLIWVDDYGNTVNSFSEWMRKEEDTFWTPVTAEVLDIYEEDSYYDDRI